MTTSTDHLFADILNTGRKVVFSRTLKTVDWTNTNIAAGDTAEEIDKPTQAARATSWSGAASASGSRLMRLDLVSSTASSGGIVELRYR